MDESGAEGSSVMKKTERSFKGKKNEKMKKKSLIFFFFFSRAVETMARNPRNDCQKASTFGNVQQSHRRSENLWKQPRPYDLRPQRTSTNLPLQGRPRKTYPKP